MVELYNAARQYVEAINYHVEDTRYKEKALNNLINIYNEHFGTNASKELIQAVIGCVAGLTSKSRLQAFNEMERILNENNSNNNSRTHGD